MNISDLLCDLYDIREMGKLCGFGKLPKDNDGTSFTIDEVLENAIELLEESNWCKQKKDTSMSFM